MVGQRLFLLKRKEPLVALLLDGLRHVIFPGGRIGPGPRGILEDVGGFVPDIAHQAHGGLKILLGLARKTHDDVG